MSAIQLGTIVTYTAELYDRTGVPSLIDWPALVYKIVEWDTHAERYVLALYVFTDEGLKQFKHVFMSQERVKETWRN